MSDSGSGGGCGKVLGYGCLAIVLLVVVGGLAIWASWDLLKQSGLGRSVAETVDTVKGQVEAANALRESLLVDYPAEDLRVDFQIHSNNGVTTKTLQVLISNPHFELPDAADARLAKAREIADAVAGRFPDLHRYDVLHLELRTLGSGSVASSSTSSYDFPTADL